MRPRWLRCLLTDTSPLRGLLAIETTSHDASKQISYFCPRLEALGREDEARYVPGDMPAHLLTTLAR